MRKALALLMTLVLLCVTSVSTFAEEENLLDTLGGIFSGLFGEVEEWADGALKDVSEWGSGAWKDASGWLENAWSDSSSWVNKIWGEASTWISENYEGVANTVETWWAENSDKVTEGIKGAWDWVKENAGELKEQGAGLWEEIKEAVSTNGADAEQKIRETLDELLKKLGIKDSDAAKIWETLQGYAEQKGISVLSAAKLAIPYLSQLCVDNGEQGESVPAINVAQSLTSFLEAIGVDSNESADELIQQLEEVLEEKE